MSEFYVGQKVVCIAGTPSEPEYELGDTLKTGSVYTIRWLGIYGFREGVVETVKLCGLSRNRGLLIDLPWTARIFRPLDSKAISIFRQIALDVSEGKKVRV